MNRILFLIGGLLLVVLLAAAWTGYRERLIPRQAQPPASYWLLTGDEPAYLLAAQAFAAGEGLDLGPAHRRGDHRRFYSRDILGPAQYRWQDYRDHHLPFLFDRQAAWGDRQIKHHMPLLPLMLAPVARTQNFRWWAGVLQSLWLGLAALMVWRQLRGGTLRQMLLIMLALLAGLGGLPAGYYTSAVFPEILGGALLLVALSLWEDQPSWPRRLGILAMLLSLWATPRVTLGVFLTVIVLSVRLARRRERGDVALLLGGVLFYFAYHLFVWGWFFPPMFDAANRPQWALLPRGVAGIFFDHAVGLLFLNPACWAMLCAGFLLWRGHRHESGVRLWGALFLGAIVSVAALPVARAGACPAGRYEVIPALLLAYAMARFIRSCPADRPGGRRIRGALLLLSVASLVIAWKVAQDPRVWFRPYHPLFAYPSLQPYYHLLPDAGSARFGWQAAGWLLIFFCCLWVGDVARWVRAKLAR